MTSQRELEPYHHVWLAEHPFRTEAWLRRRLQDGFHIHHIDGNHSNNDPMNLVLIDGADHFFIHNGKKRPVRFIREPKPEVVRIVQKRPKRKNGEGLPLNRPPIDRSQQRTELLRKATEAAKARVEEQVAKNDPRFKSLMPIKASG